jgi:hypothetical protein
VTVVATITVESEGSKPMKRRVLSGVILAVLACSAAVFAMASTAGATTPQLTLTVGTPIRVTNRLLVSVPIQVVCQPIGNPADITLNDSVNVSLSQANGKSVSTGSAMVSSGPFSPQNPTGTGLFTCDGSTVNTLTVQVLGNATFRGGGAILTASASHSVGTCIFQGFCQSSGNESASVGPVGVPLRGGGQ